MRKIIYSTAYLQQEIAEDTLQRLAGFKVEKKITYFDDRSISPSVLHGD